jgi:hypothetical protein
MSDTATTDPKNERLKQLLDEFRDSRAKAATMFATFPEHPGVPHKVLDASDTQLAVYLNEFNGSVRALNEAQKLSGSGKGNLPEHEIHVCEYCQKVVVDVPGDIGRGQPFGSVQSIQPSARIGPLRREAVYDTEVWAPGSSPSWSAGSTTTFKQKSNARRIVEIQREEVWDDLARKYERLATRAGSKAKRRQFASRARWYRRLAAESSELPQWLRDDVEKRLDRRWWLR